MTLVDQLRNYIAPDDDTEDRTDIRLLMIAGADRIAQLEAELALQKEILARYHMDNCTRGPVIQAYADSDGVPPGEAL